MFSYFNQLSHESPHVQKGDEAQEKQPVLKGDEALEKQHALKGQKLLAQGNALGCFGRKSVAL